MTGGGLVTDDVGRSAALDPAVAARLKRDANGLFAAIAQQHDTGEVLMLAWMDDEALHRTLTTGRCIYWALSRRKEWVNSGTSRKRQRMMPVGTHASGSSVHG